MQLRFAVLLLFLSFGMGIHTYAQSGTIRGKVSDGSTGEVLLGATVRVLQGGQIKGGAYTDLEGSYTAKVPGPGTYTVLTSYISFITDTSEVIVEAGQIALNEVLLFEETAVNEDLAVNIVAKRNEASDVAFQSKKQNSINAIDGVTFDLVQRTGDNNVAAAMQRVVGVTVQDGKYIYVRGLGDRYSQTLLNGASLPSLDPNRNSVQMDIFPSNLIDNVVVYKNFTPDLPGNFTGGLVDVRTKDFPDRFTLNVSASLGYNTNSSFRDDFFTDVQSETDGLGFDNGQREIPAIIGEPGSFLPDGIPNTDFEEGAKLDEGIKAFEQPLYPVIDNTFMDQNYQVSAGNQFQLGENTYIGVIGSLSYRSEFEFTDEGGNAFFNISGPNDRSLAQEQLYNTVQNTSRDVLFGAMGRVSLKVGPRNKVSFNYMHNNSGSTQARIFAGSDASNTIANLESRSVNYLERNLDVFQLNGQHVFGPVTFDWIASRALSSQNQPDQRFISNFVDFEADPVEYGFDQSEGLIAQRFFRSLADQSDDVKLNFTYDFELGERKGFIKAGGAFTTRDRVYEQRLFDYEGNQIDAISNRINWDGDPATLFTEENEGIIGDTTIVERVDGQFVQVPAPLYGLLLFENEVRASEDVFDGDQDVIAGYAMVEFPITDRLNFIGGARYEYSTQRLLATTRENESVNEIYNDVLPSANLIFKATDVMNIRAGYSRTLARPSFRELAEIQYIDFLGDFAEIGNPNLTRTLIDNADVRWEWFFNVNELVSVSAFYKVFNDPIFRVPDTLAQNATFTYANLNNGLVYGLEFEAKKSFEFISPALQYFFISGNFSLIQSQVGLTTQELNQRRANFPGLPDTRPMYSQSPYAVNAELLYNNPLVGFQTSLSFNIFGPRLVATGASNSLDAYEQPRGLLNLSISKRLWQRWSVRVRANNLLNPEYFSTTTLTPEVMGLTEGDFEPIEYRFRSAGRRGRSFSISLSYNIR